MLIADVKKKHNQDKRTVLNVAEGVLRGEELEELDRVIGNFTCLQLRWRKQGRVEYWKLYHLRESSILRHRKSYFLLRTVEGKFVVNFKIVCDVLLENKSLDTDCLFYPILDWGEICGR